MAGANTVTVTDDTFASVIEGAKGLAIVDFWAPWCRPCVVVGPIVDQLATQYADKGLVAGKVDVDSNPQMTVRFNVRSIPAILFFKGGKHVDTVIGAVPKAFLEKKVLEHL